jgi:hypothetical protein
LDLAVMMMMMMMMMMGFSAVKMISSYRDVLTVAGCYSYLLLRAQKGELMVISASLLLLMMNSQNYERHQGTTASTTLR